MTIGPEDRKFGVDSLTMASKKPETTFYDSAFLLGVDYSDEVLARLKENFIANDFVVDERGLIAYQTFSIKSDESQDSDKTTYFTEDIVAQILWYGKFLAER